MTYKDLPLIIAVIAMLIIGLTFMVTEKEQPENHFDNYPITGQVWEAK